MLRRVLLGTSALIIDRSIRAAQPGENIRRGLFTPIANLPCRAGTGGATLLAGAVPDQFGRLREQAIAQPIEGRAQTDSTSVRIVEIQVFAQSHTQIARIAHQQQRGNRSESVA